MKTPKYNSGWIWAYFTHLHKNPAKFCYFRLLGYPQSVHQTPHWIQHPHRPTRWPPLPPRWLPRNAPPHRDIRLACVCLHDWLILIWIQRKKYICSPCMHLMGGGGKTKLPKDESPVASGRRFWSGFCKHKHVMSFIRGEHPSFFLEVLVKHYHCNSPRLYVKFRWIFLNMLGWFCFSKWIPLF